ncbi:MAG TPA: PhzF family phenazine biosynthesis protein [Pseudomonadales bacterium]
MRLHIVDVFAETRYAGNQLAVVRDCAQLSDEAMQTIAREMNFSETTFVVAESATRAKVRILTPGTELPVAGQPTIGTAWVLGHQRPSYVLELAAGDVEVRLDGAAGIAWMVPPKPVLGARFPADRAARLLGLVSADLASELPAQIVEIGPKFVFIGVRDLATLRRARLDQAYHRACLDEGLPVHSVFVFAPQAYSADAQYSARLFFDANGIREDPATGSANSGFAAYLHSHLKRPIDVIVEQGFEIKRPSRLYLHCDDKGLRVGGRVQAVSEGRLL